MSNIFNQCDSTKPHTPHTYEKEIEVGCSGKTECGQWSHTAHTIKVKVYRSCIGVGDATAEFYNGSNAPTYSKQGEIGKDI